MIPSGCSIFCNICELCLRGAQEKFGLGNEKCAVSVSLTHANEQGCCVRKKRLHVASNFKGIHVSFLQGSLFFNI